MGLIVHTVQHVAASFRLPIDHATQDDLVADVFLAILDRDFAVLRRFRGESSLASYLVVVARRTVTKRLAHRKLRAADVLLESRKLDSVTRGREEVGSVDWNRPEAFHGLSDAEASAMRMYHLEGKSYREIGSQLGLAENSIGPFLSRARQKMRRHA